jgi:hypothetical protein
VPPPASRIHGDRMTRRRSAAVPSQMSMPSRTSAIEKAHRWRAHWRCYDPFRQFIGPRPPFVRRHLHESRPCVARQPELGHSICIRDDPPDCLGGARARSLPRIKLLTARWRTLAGRPRLSVYVDGHSHTEGRGAEFEELRPGSFGKDFDERVSIPMLGQIRFPCRHVALSSGGHARQITAGRRFIGQFATLHHDTPRARHHPRFGREARRDKRIDDIGSGEALLDDKCEF